MKVYSVSSPKQRNFFYSLSWTTYLILINILVFIVFTILTSLKIVPIEWVAINPGNIFGGRYPWTFITSMFMHAGFFHLLFNMLSLFFIGGLIEKLIGRKRYFWLYLLSGVFAGVFFVLSALVIPNEMNSFAVGASGALFALVGILMLLTPNLRVYVMFIPIPIKMKYAAPGLLIVLWLISIAGNVPIGNLAHLGGLVAGLAYGFYLKKKFPRKTKYISERFK